MVLRQEIFSYMKDGEELAEEPFRRLIKAGRLMAYAHDGYWACMDTFKEKQDLEDVFAGVVRLGPCGIISTTSRNDCVQSDSRKARCFAWERTATTSRSAVVAQYCE